MIHPNHRLCRKWRWNRIPGNLSLTEWRIHKSTIPATPAVSPCGSSAWQSAASRRRWRWRHFHYSSPDAVRPPPTAPLTVPKPYWRSVRTRPRERLVTRRIVTIVFRADRHNKQSVWELHRDPRSDLSDMKSMQVISDLFDSLRNPDFIKNVCRGMSYMDATLFLPTFRSNVYYAYACPKYSFLTSHNTLYSSLLKIKYPKYSFALYISPLYLCITKPDHHIIYLLLSAKP